jgi:hypothetical protein
MELTNAPQQATSLDLLHDLALPQEVSWWPLAPGWYAVLVFVAAAIVLGLYRLLARYRTNAYRRAALRELATLEDQSAIAELLRRTALAVVPRTVIADLTSGQWLDWLSKHNTQPMPESIKSQLIQGVYGTACRDSRRVVELKQYAAHWISNHQIPPANP